jgi:glycosyltransferase involved in cell wall biosynthesis
MNNKKAIVLSFQSNLYAILISSFFKNKIVVRLNSSPSGWIKSEFKKKLFKKIYSLANLIIVNSKDFRKEMLTKFKIKSECIFNPLDKKNIIKKSKIKLNRNPYKINNSLKIINIGRLVDQKDQLTLLKAINLLKNKLKIELLIIGRGEYKNKLKNFIKENFLEKNVKIIDFKNNPYPFINSSDLFILSSKYEGLPNVILEAIVLKKFVISSDCPTGPKEILDNGKGGELFKTGSYTDLSKKILKFTKNKKLKKKINFAYRSLDKYNHKKNLNKYFNKIIEVSS